MDNSELKQIKKNARISSWMGIACAIHCAAMPLSMTVLPLIGLEFLANHIFELLFISVGLGFGIYSVYKAWYHHHRNILPFLLVGAGMVMILIGLFVVKENAEPFWVAGGALLSGVAQVVNVRLSHKCSTCAA